jgi:predicted glycogen debranching enzyme
MLPNRFPDVGEKPEYNTADATLWYFEALRAYYESTEDKDLIQELYPILTTIVDEHVTGTRFNIGLDPADGLIYAGEQGVQLTWMDAKVDNWVVTPRIGKPVEINALWYNALEIMASFADLIGESPERFQKLALRAKKGFGRFWNDSKGYCYDVLDGPDGDDLAMRPNQILAVSLRHSPLSGSQRKMVVDSCASQLLTPYGLRTLSPDHPAYAHTYGGDIVTRDSAYHQGTVWAWLIGPFVAAYLRVYGEQDAARLFLQPLLQHVGDYGLGTVSEIFDGDSPFTPRGCPAQAWSVAELLTTLQITSGTMVG